MKANEQMASKIFYLYSRHTFGLKKATKCTQVFMIDGTVVQLKRAAVYSRVCLGRQGCLESAPAIHRSMAMKSFAFDEKVQKWHESAFLLVAGCLFYFDISLMRRPGNENVKDKMAMLLVARHSLHIFTFVSEHLEQLYNTWTAARLVDTVQQPHPHKAQRKYVPLCAFGPICHLFYYYLIITVIRFTIDVV